MNVVVIGAGLMGSQIGCEYALAGDRVAFFSRDPERARRRLHDAFAVVERFDLANGDERPAALSRTTVIERLDDASRSIDLIIESLPESQETKIPLLRDAAVRWPNAVLASNTSSLSITGLGDGAGAPERTIGAHYWNPPLLMPLVEVIAGERTATSVTEMVLAKLRSIGKRPVLIQRDVPGFVWNRLQLALLREAAWIVENGVASAEVVDEIVRDGLARRWRLTGPFETVALGGAATFERISRNLFPVLSDSAGLENIDRWLIHDDARLQEIRSDRDLELIVELRRDRNSERTRTDGGREQT